MMKLLKSIPLHLDLVPHKAPRWLLKDLGPDFVEGTEVTENHSMNQQASDVIKNVMQLA